MDRIIEMQIDAQYLKSINRIREGTMSKQLSLKNSKTAKH